MFLRRMFILLTLGCLIGATALAATPDYATLGVTNGQDLGTTVHRHANGGAGKLVNTHRVPMSGTPEEIAARFVAENAQTLFDAPAAADKAGDVQVGALTFKLVRVTSSMSGDHVWMQAFAGDVPVRGGYVVTHLTHDGQVLFVTNELGDVGFELAASAVSLDRASALAAAARIIGGDGLTRVEPKADLVVLREGNRGRLAWRTETATYNPYGDWEIMVDAANGAEISRRDLIIFLKPQEKPASINPPTAPRTPHPADRGANNGIITPNDLVDQNGAGQITLADALGSSPNYDPNTRGFAVSNGVAPNLDPQMTDELLLSVEHALRPEFVVGVNLTYRKISDIVETDLLVFDDPNGLGASSPTFINQLGRLL